MDFNLDDNEKVEPGELLEDCWFFGNLLQRKPRMLRSYSDPCSSSNYTSPESNLKSYEETYDSIRKLPEGRNRTPTNGLHISGSNRRASANGLVRAPSLPTSLETKDEDEDEEEEVEFSMGKLIRQASLNYSDKTFLPPRNHANKILTANSSILRQKPRRKPEVEIIKRPNNQLKTQKSMKDLESEELQGFKDLGFDFDKKDISPNVIGIIPGLQEKKRIEEDEERRIARPYLSEAWGAPPPPPPPVPRWGGRRSTEDMKAQIKFWARAVASNVRQEC